MQDTNSQKVLHTDRQINDQTNDHIIFFQIEQISS